MIPVQREEEMTAINAQNLVLGGVADLEPICEIMMARCQINTLCCYSECETHSVLFVRMTRANLFCKPNAPHNHVPKFQIKTLEATRDISVEDVITYVYAARDNTAGIVTEEFC